jgi:membrane associated rhomboid family serine protease
MATKTFGRRGAAPRMANPSFQPAPAAVAPDPMVEQAAELSVFDWAIRDNKLIADLPLLTVGLILFLVVVFWLERRVAFDIGGGELSLRALIELGGASRDLVVGSGQWWRIALAPILHSSTAHILGNSVALAIVGLRLEPIIGRGWFLLIFVVSAIGGVAGSLYGNEPGVVSVGASDAITGLLAALVVMSFNPYADIDQRQTMRRTALRFGVPALLALAWAAWPGVDYFCDAGGALAGGAAGMVICAVWSHDSVRPDFARVAGIVALAGFAGSLLSFGFAATRYPGYAAGARQFVRLAEMPKDARSAAPQPEDPMAHITRALELAENGHLGQAEAELREAIALTSADPAGRVIRIRAQGLLAALLQAQGRHEEAEAMAGETCRAARDFNAVTRLLLKDKVLCE